MNLQGKIALDHQGRAYNLTIDMSALCVFEDVTGKNGFAMLRLLERGGIAAGLVGARDLRALIYGGLKSHDPDMTLELAGQILDSNAEILAAAVRAASLQEGDLPPSGAKPGNRRRPRKRRAK